jgi:endonuclease/exonuclease/phosphatase (EEP) superfamily protein YafD
VGAVVAWGLAAVLIGLWALTFAGRRWSDPPVPVAAAITFLPYLYGGFVALVAAVWVVVPDRRLPPMLITGTVLSAVALWGPGMPGGDPAGGDPIRVVSWNVRRLWGAPPAVGSPDDRALAVRCVVRAVEESDPDVLTLMEVSRADVATLATRLGLSCVHTDYSGGGEQAGIATCARGDRWSLRRGAGQRFVDDEDWYYEFAEVGRGDRVFNLLGVHLTPYRFAAARFVDLPSRGKAVFRAQGNQSAALLDQVSRFHDPTVVAGDFNSTRDTALHTSLREHLVDAWERAGSGLGGTTRFLDALPLRVDYVYVTPGIAVRGVRVLPDACSDHQAVVADLAIGVDAN